ncbi:helix-turn-helix domain-containing protein [Patescibacteria group bacterium]|nr:helix-turn-helix domain-containing protein [Patescibacteria group bacterium]
MFSTADLLKNTRLDKDFNLQEISHQLKIPLKYLQAIEEDDFASFPKEPYCSLIIKDYAQFLKLDGSEILKLFNRDYNTLKSKPEPKKRVFSFTPQSTFIFLSLLSLLVFSSYLIFEYIKFQKPPRLTVNWPDQSLSQPQLYLSGTTDPESTVRINKNLTIVDINGNFSQKIDLNPGENQITVEAESPSGKINSSQETLVYNQ